METQRYICLAIVCLCLCCALVTEFNTLTTGHITSIDSAVLSRS